MLCPELVPGHVTVNKTPHYCLKCHNDEVASVRRMLLGQFEYLSKSGMHALPLGMYYMHEMCTGAVATEPSSTGLGLTESQQSKRASVAGRC